MTAAMPDAPDVRHRLLDLSTAVTVHIAEAGPQDAPPVLALHGWPQHWYAWRSVIPLLAGERRVIAADLRGLGWSGWPDDGDFRKARMAEDAVALLDALGIERALLLGHDWGAWAGFLAALQAPERWTGLVAASVPHPWQPRTRALRHAYRLAYQPLLAAPFISPRVMPQLAALALRSMAGDGPRPGGDEVFIAAYREPRRAEAASRLYRDFLLHEALPGVRGRLTVPTRLLYGTRDPLGTAFAEGLERHGDDARTILLEGAGHRVPEERPEAVASAVRELTPAPSRPPAPPPG
ncbi:alpha/beta fold hydrolase [Candidatus Solirubrobacter pratensis]|uniref:alpha/beta fold hydrolase n=1 Tax=Candidatus Solirubrobacter pratensis TaxID=1298857 RepID=UPI00041CC6CB|nr:alpha/beta fold hydrolase [Candidatus Solirubrobacter pratensis]